MSKVLILDFGSQFTQLITRRVRELHIYSEIQSFDYSIEKIKADSSISAIILSGGPNSIYDVNSPTINIELFNLGVPVLGICYGLQLMGHLLGGKVEASNVREYGRALLEPNIQHPIFENLPAKKNINVWMSHGDHITELPSGFNVIASTEDCNCAAIANDELKFYGFQFHPEVAHSQYGDIMLSNFLLKIANIEANWTPKSFIQNEIEKIKAKVGDKKVLCGLSGGVDSSVAAVLIHKAIGDQLHCMFVDNGLLRKNERDQVEKTFKENFKINLNIIDASDLFLGRLEGITDPEQKRKIIGSTFIEVFEKESKELGEFEFLAQGTLYPDVIESQSVNGGPSHIIKSHHNVGGLPKEMKFKLLEPLRELFKDEVREIGRELGISEDIVGRHPFPGPGLGIRIIGDITRDKLDILQKADQIFIDELKNWKLQPSSNTDFLFESDESQAGMMHEDYRGSVHAIIFNPNLGKYLVIEDKTNLRSNKNYYFVGGRAKGDETPKEALIREIQEETGLTYDDTSKMFYYGKIKQTYYLRASNGFPEKNRIQISDIYYVETYSTDEGFCEAPELKTKWVSWVELEKNLLEGFKWVLLNCKANHSLYQQVWQAFCVLTEVKSIGVMGDGRTYENMLALRAVSASDGMTADWSRLPYEFLAKVSNRIINEVKGINRVTYDISSKPPATIEWE